MPVIVCDHARCAVSMSTANTLLIRPCALSSSVLPPLQTVHVKSYSYAGTCVHNGVCINIHVTRESGYDACAYVRYFSTSCK